jgi:hypothetical protein
MLRRVWVNLSVRAITPNVRNSIIVVAVSPATLISNEFCQSATNYISRDIVPLVGNPMGLIDCYENTVYLKPHADSNFIDHEFDSPTYRDHISKKLNTNIQKFKWQE